MSQPSTVDIVLLFVDANAPGFLDEHQRYLGTPSACHFRTLGELRYVLRSIERYANWDHRVFLVVKDRGHVPAWLDDSTVRIVCHEAFIPAAILPVFSPFPIQAHIHRIPDLSDRFILWSDDKFLGSPTDLSAFFDSAGRPNLRVFHSPIIENQNRALYSLRLFNTRRLVNQALADRGERLGLDGRWGHFLFPHLPVPARREWWKEMVDLFSAYGAFEETVSARNRDSEGESEDRVLVVELFADWVNLSHMRVSWIIKWLSMLRRKIRQTLARIAWSVGVPVRMDYGIYKVRNDPVTTKNEMARLLRERPKAFCINDEAYDPHTADGVSYETQLEIVPASLTALSMTLEQLFPERSLFEGAAEDGPPITALPRSGPAGEPGRSQP